MSMSTAIFVPLRVSKVRAISYPGQVTILFYCLDPQFPGLRHVSALDVDGFLTNSHATQAYLLPSAPTALVPLAVDIEAFPFYPDPPPPPSPATMDALLADWEVGPRMGSGRVVYVGAAGAMEYKRMLAWMLRDAVPYGLDIYGSGWQDVPEFSTYWRGVLPEGDLVSGVCVCCDHFLPLCIVLNLYFGIVWSRR